MTAVFLEAKKYCGSVTRVRPRDMYLLTTAVQMSISASHSKRWFRLQ